MPTSGPVSGEEFTKTAHEAAKTIVPILLQYPPVMQGAILAELLGFWLACHPATARERIWETHRTLTRVVMQKGGEMLGDGKREN